MMETFTDGLKEFGVIFLILVATFVAAYMMTQGYNWADHFFTHSLTTSAPHPLMQVQQVGHVFNPFVLDLVNSRIASLKDGVSVSVTSSVPCWLGVFWGTKIADVYPIVYSPWPSFQELASFKQSLCSISQHNEEFNFEEAIEKKELTLKTPSFLDLGLPPRVRYPLLLIVLDSRELERPWSEVKYLQQIVCMVAIVHLRDDHCPSESHVFSQLVRCPLGKPCDLKQLYMSGLEDSSNNGSSTSLPDNVSQSATDSSATSALCSVCQSHPVEQAILPCRHACTCTGCCARLINCPICRAFIISTFPLDTA